VQLQLNSPFATELTPAERAPGLVQALWWATLSHVVSGAVGAGIEHKWVLFALIVAEALGFIGVLVLSARDPDLSDDVPFVDRSWFLAGLVLWLLWLAFSIGTAIVSGIGGQWGELGWGLAGSLVSCLLLCAAVAGVVVPDHAEDLVDDAKNVVDGFTGLVDPAGL
jgi:hypothetical protein